MTSDLLVEKYRPKTIRDVIGLKGFELASSSIPHLLFFGPPGTGKTTLAKIIIKDLDVEYLLLNASDERGIETIRQKVKVFSSTRSNNGLFKVVFLDEADHLTVDAQTSLRNMMETYSDNVRFILTCNYMNKVIEPLQSRCVKVEFGNIESSDIEKRLLDICEKENIKYDINAIKKIVERNGTDIRSSINKLEELKDVGILLENLRDESKIAADIIELLKLKDFEGARNKYLNGHTDDSQLLKDIYWVVWDDNTIGDKRKAIWLIADCDRWIRQVAWPQIQVERLFAELMDVL